MLKTVHAQKCREATLKKVEAVAEELRSMELKETLIYMSFPSEYWLRT